MAAVTGRVSWRGPRPDVPPIHGLVRNQTSSRWDNVPNNFAPRIEAQSGGIAGAVVWLAGVDASQAKAWPYAPLKVEIHDNRIRAVQGEQPGPVGFVRVGDEIPLLSLDSEYHMLRARGAAFFTLPLPKPHTPISRKFDQAGIIEFTSGAGFFWSAADVFVCEHPYFTTTNTDGTFRFEGVPPGEYEAVAWLRNWQILEADRDPETGRTMRLKFGEPFLTRVKVSAQNGTIPSVELVFPVSTEAKN